MGNTLHTIQRKTVTIPTIKAEMKYDLMITDAYCRFEKTSNTKYINPMLYLNPCERFMYGLVKFAISEKKYIAIMVNSGKRFLYEPNGSDTSKKRKNEISFVWNKFAPFILIENMSNAKHKCEISSRFLLYNKSAFILIESFLQVFDSTPRPHTPQTCTAWHRLPDGMSLRQESGRIPASCAPSHPPCFQNSQSNAPAHR